MKHCPQCQRAYEDTQKFCPQDGTPLTGGPAPAGPWTQQPGASQPGPPPPSNYPPYNVGAAPGGGAPPPPYPPPPPAWQTPTPPRGRKIWPWVLGGAVVVGLGFFVLVGIVAYVAYRQVETKKDESAPVAGARAVETKSYVNSRANFSGKLVEHYSDFSFDYPASWKLDPEAGKGADPNFVKVEREVVEGGREYTLENFAVGWYTSTGTLAGDRALLPRLVGQLSSQFAQSIPNYQKLSEGETRLGQYDGYELRFKGEARDTPKGNVTIYGRTVLIPGGSAAKRNGVALIMLASSLVPEIEGAEDVGVKGETPVVLNSFRLGP